MTLEETAGILAILAEMWPTQALTEQTVKAYQFVWADLPLRLVEDAAREWLHGDHAFWPRAGQLRAAALRAGLGLAPAEVAYEEVRCNVSAVGRYAVPRWSSAALERAVNSIGWREICDWPTETIGVLRAQLRDAYDAILEADLGKLDASAALEEARQRKAALAECGPVAHTFPEGTPVRILPSGGVLHLLGPEDRPALPAPLAAPSAWERGYVTMGKQAPATLEAQRRFLERNSGKVLVGAARGLPEMLAILEAAPGWKEMPEGRRQMFLDQYRRNHPEQGEGAE